VLGLARTISDGQTVAYFQDLLMEPRSQRHGTGEALLDEVLYRTRDIRQFVLLTGAEPTQSAFYESRRLVETRDVRPTLIDQLARCCHDGFVDADLEPALVPELLVADLSRSLSFWVGLCGFSVRYSRPEEGFAYIARGTAHVMLEQIGVGRNWVTGALESPLGRGINFQVSVPDCSHIAEALRAAGVELFMEPETKWYRVDDHAAGVQQFLVTDPDGYLLRFQSSVGRRNIAR
jgi:catechol 2,3-dioxygenase-like lactoylglutathione lyase family enzyme